MGICFSRISAPDSRARLLMVSILEAIRQIDSLVVQPALGADDQAAPIHDPCIASGPGHRPDEAAVPAKSCPLGIACAHGPCTHAV
jgi:hypothetical protein